MRRHWLLTVTAVICGAFLTLASPSGGVDTGSAPGSIAPIALSIKSVDNVELTVGKDLKATVSISYARQGATVFPLPVWVVQGKAELRAGSETAPRLCSSDRALIGTGDPVPMRLRVRVANLLAGEQTRRAVHLRLRDEITELAGEKVASLRLENPLFDRNGFRVTLCASGGGEQPEATLSQTTRLPPAIVQARARWTWSCCLPPSPRGRPTRASPSR